MEVCRKRFKCILKMKKVKCILLTLLAVTCIDSKAQMVVTDPSGMANDIAQFSSKIEEIMTQTFYLGEQAVSMQEMLNVSKDVKNALTTVSDYVGKAEDLERFERSIENSISLLKQGKEVIMNTGFDPSVKLEYITRVMNMVNHNVQLCTQFIKDFTPGNKSAGNLTDAERIELKEDALQTVSDNNAQIAREIMKALKAEKAMRDESFRGNMTFNSMFFNVYEKK